VFAADGSVILAYGKFRHQDVALDRISPHVIQALLATEDRRFYSHPGVDPISLLRAIARDIKNRKLLEGGSTLTQQLARTLFLSNERSFKRKIREIALAFKLEQRLSKREILELYLNTVYFGEGAYGVAAASEIYFNKKPADLNIEESALLAGMPQAPTLYNPLQNPKFAKDRRDEVLQNMVEAGKLDPDTAKRLQQKPLRLNPAASEVSAGDKAPFFNRYVLNQVKQQFDLDEQSFWQSGLKIYTTLDPHAQFLAARAVKAGSKQFGRLGPRQQAALITLNPRSGAILAYVGGKEYAVSQFDRVSQALRSPGSLFKVFTYTAAMEKGFEPGRVYLDEPISFGDWAPQNYDRRHLGYMTVARALAISNNVVAVKVLNELGPPAVIDVAQRMGLHATLDPNLALTLGGSGVTLLDITAAFSVLNNQGVRTEPYAIERIVDTSGREIYRRRGRKVDVLDRATVDTMVHMMTGVLEYGTGHAADIGRPAAGKTGTSDDHRDAWFIGFTPEVITGVWVGNDDNTPMPKMTGGSLPAIIWRNYMRAFLADRLMNNFDLAYSKPLTPKDFTSYKLSNLSQSERYDPNLVQPEDNALPQPGEMEETAAEPPAQQDAPPPDRVISTPENTREPDEMVSPNMRPGATTVGPPVPATVGPMPFPADANRFPPQNRGRAPLPQPPGAPLGAPTRIPPQPEPDTWTEEPE
jgi:penicillin-binding protein 1A